jgi:hypothetical protein
VSTAADTILATLRAGVPGGVTIYDSMVPGVPTPRYVVLYCPAGWRESSTVTGASEDIHLSFQTTSVASDANPAYSAAYCRWLQSVVRDLLTDLTVTASGWAPAVIRHEGSQYPQPDETTPDKKVYATDQFSLTTVRTA